MKAPLSAASSRPSPHQAKAAQPREGTGERVDAERVVAQRGAPLDAGTRAEMEARFHYSFADVRVHADAEAAASAQALNARAYTLDQRIVFGANRYAPATDEGRRLLAHELAHTIQQRNGGHGRGSAAPEEMLESSANAAALDVAAGDAVALRLPASGRRIQRAPLTDLRWKKDVQAAHYRGQQLAARVKRHGKLSSDARKQANEELAYFEGAAKEAYVREVKPTLAQFVEIEMPAMDMSAQPAKPEPAKQAGPASQQQSTSQTSDYEAMAAYYASTRESQLEAAETAHASFREGVAQMSATEIESQWDFQKREFLKVASSSSNKLNRGQMLEIWRLYWADQYKASQTALMHVTDHKPAERMEAQERAEHQESLANFMLRSVVLANEFLIAAENEKKHVTIDELNKAASELETFHENMVAASGMILPGEEAEGAAARLEDPVIPPVEPVEPVMAPARAEEPPAGGGGGTPGPPSGTGGGNSPRPPAQTIKASPPPPPGQASRLGEPVPVTDVEVVQTNVQAPGSVKTQAPTAHQTDWTARGGRGKAPAAYRDSEGNVHVSTEHPLMGDPKRGGGISPVRAGDKSSPAGKPAPKPPAANAKTKTSGGNIGLEDTGQAPAPAKPAVDAGAKTPAAPAKPAVDVQAKTPPAAPKDAPVPKGAPTGGAAAESQREQAPAPRGQAARRPIDPPQALSREGVENIRNRPRTVDPKRKGSGSNVQYTTDHAAHEQAWQRLGGRGESPPAFIYDNQVYLDPTRWQD